MFDKGTAPDRLRTPRTLNDAFGPYAVLTVEREAPRGRFVAASSLAVIVLVGALAAWIR